MGVRLSVHELHISAVPLGDRARMRAPLIMRA